MIPESPPQAPITCLVCKEQWLPTVARLHRQGITTGFLSRLGAPFLSALYGAIATSRWSTVIVATAAPEGGPVGFVACSIDTARMYRAILLKRGQFAVLLLPQLFRISVMKRIVETALYPMTHGRVTGPPKTSADAPTHKASSSPPRAELLSIAVDEQWRKKGVGTLLVKEMERYFSACDVREYKVATFARDQNSNRFYKACGFALAGTFIHHGNEMCEYVKEL